MDNMKENNEIKSANKTGIIVSIVTFLAILFCGSYYLTDYIINSNVKEPEEMIEEDKSVYSQNNKYIKDGTIVTLKTGENVDSEQTVDTIKKSNDITRDITKEELSEILSKEGYILREISESKVLFVRNKEYETLGNVEPNKYFIGEKEGYLAIYKSDENGILTITSEEDVFRGKKRVLDLPKVDQERIKKLEFKYDTRNEALQDITEFIS